MAKLLEARIAKLAGRSDDVEIEFQPDLNVFWGRNGSGKTSFLKILHSALTGDASSIVRVPFRTAQVAFEHNGKTYTRTITKGRGKRNVQGASDQDILELLEDASLSLVEKEEYLLEVRGSFQWKTVPEPPRGIRRFPHGYLPISRMTDLANVSHRHAIGRRETTGLLNEALIDEEFARQTTALWRDYSNSALIRIRQAQEEGLAEVLSEVLTGDKVKVRSKARISSDTAYDLISSFFSGQRIAPQLTSADKIAESYENNRVLQAVVARIAEVQQSIKLAQEPQRRLMEMFSSLFPNKKIDLDARMGVTVTIGSERIPLESLSSGEKQIVRLLLECLAARSNSILIDEPELSLHVDWQHRLVSFMRLINPEAQLLLATHSPEVMADVPGSKVFEL